jgi:hypothetical protein
MIDTSLVFCVHDQSKMKIKLKFHYACPYPYKSSMVENID